MADENDSFQGAIPPTAGLRGPLSYSEQAGNLGRDAVSAGQSLLSTLIGPNWISGDFPNFYSQDPEERRRAYNALASSVGPQRIDFNPIGGSFAAGTGNPVGPALADYMRRAWPDIRMGGMSSNVPMAKNPRGFQDIEKLVSTLAKNPDPNVQEYANILGRYMGALSSWLGSTPYMRMVDAQPGAGNPETGDLQNYATMIKNLLTSSKNISTSPLFRSSSLREMPNKAVGETFESPFLSFTTSRPYAQTEKNVIVLEPGAKTLPIAGVAGGRDELEHIVGGKFRITDIKEGAGRKIVRVSQVPEK